jgi:osmotically-inducible protein OsmY
MSKLKGAKRWVGLVSLALVALTTLSGCGALVVGGAATGAVVATDRRSTGEQVDDQTIGLKIASDMNSLFGDKARVNTTSYAGQVLLTGDVPTDQAKQQAQSAASKVSKVKTVVNELRVGDITPLSVRTNDTWLTSKVKAELLNTKNVPSRTIVVTTERGVVYLQGKVTDTEGQMAATAASTISGVNKVVKLFQIVSAASLQQSTTPAPIQNDATPAASTAAPAGTSGDTQALPIK